MSYIWLLLILLLLVTVIYIRGSRWASDFETQLALPSREIEIVSFKLLPPCAFGPRMEARIINHSPRLTLRTLTLRITILAPRQGAWQPMGRCTEWLSLHVPPEKTTTILEYVHLPDRPYPWKQIRWTCEIIAAKGHPGFVAKP